MKYRRKHVPVIVEAFTFDELVAHGKEQNAPLTNGLPYPFDYKNHLITYENDYYLIPTLENAQMLRRGDMLVVTVHGEIYVVDREVFADNYDSV